MSTRRNHLQALIEGAVLATLAALMSYFPLNFTPAISIVLGGIPITLYAMRHGLAYSIYASLLWGLLQILLGNAILLSPMQTFVEYGIAFAFNGFAAFFTSQFQNTLKAEQVKLSHFYLWLAAFAGTLARYFWHFIAGIIFWSHFTPEGMSPVIYSLIPNAISVPFTTVIIGIILSLLLKTSPRLFRS